MVDVWAVHSGDLAARAAPPSSLSLASSPRATRAMSAPTRSIRASQGTVKLTRALGRGVHRGWGRGKTTQQSSEADLEAQNDQHLNDLHSKISALRGVRLSICPLPSSRRADPFSSPRLSPSSDSARLSSLLGRALQVTSDIYQDSRAQNSLLDGTVRVPSASTSSQDPAWLTLLPTTSRLAPLGSARAFSEQRVRQLQDVAVQHDVALHAVSPDWQWGRSDPARDRPRLCGPVPPLQGGDEGWWCALSGGERASLERAVLSIPTSPPVLLASAVWLCCVCGFPSCIASRLSLPDVFGD